MGKLNGEPISCISAVRYNYNFNFIGIYIVKSQWRKQGFGLKTWQQALNLINQKPAALDAVLQQVDNYHKFGFKPTHNHCRYQGIIKGQISEDIIDLKTINFEQLCRYDSQYFPAYRPQFLKQWINQPHGTGYGIINNNELASKGCLHNLLSSPRSSDFVSIA
ncbi:GNAT family N-acetyltransferase [Aphanothece sacrum]|uniref:GCN5 family acetyltransferase n=1 Tax=Aphanothece sacrum FPU1 TaxID=1920663 RepID=A0A401ID22_APHSA|nr:GNAT family N-acetyltransferase [Aphanothece sacrum]GBF79141.1 GCN5 family acetyltransferase [Aphanothece sacrum FPU1]GBF86530.1 GCN5 family acetyltransferase [Aphanothece sacrum FPU3]